MLGGGLSSAFIEEDIYLFILFGGAPRLEGINLTRQDGELKTSNTVHEKCFLVSMLHLE